MPGNTKSIPGSIALLNWSPRVRFSGVSKTTIFIQRILHRRREFWYPEEDSNLQVSTFGGWWVIQLPYRGIESLRECEVGR